MLGQLAQCHGRAEGCSCGRGTSHEKAVGSWSCAAQGGIGENEGDGGVLDADPRESRGTQVTLESSWENGGLSDTSERSESEC